MDEYKVGDWVITIGYSGKYDGIPLKICRIEGDYCYFENGDAPSHNFMIGDIRRLATPGEIYTWKLEEGWFEGDLKGFPKEVVTKMLERQVEQGNKRDITVFEKNARENDDNGGFYWYNAPEGDLFWGMVIDNRDFELFFEKYPKEGANSRFPFRLSYNNQKRMFDAACNKWKSILAEKFSQLGAEQFKGAPITIPEDFYKEMRAACTKEQHKLLDEIFGEDSKLKRVYTIWDGSTVCEGDDIYIIPGGDKKREVIADTASDTTCIGKLAFSTIGAAETYLKDKIWPKKDTLVYVRDNTREEWRMRFYSHYANDFHRMLVEQKKSKDCVGTVAWKQVSLTNPLIEEPVLI